MTIQEKRAAEYKVQNEVHTFTAKLVGQLYIKYRHLGELDWTDLGLVSEAIVTDAFIAMLILELQGTNQADLQTYKYHASGTGTAAESAADTALGTEVETRTPTGSQTSTGAGNYRSVAIHSYSGSFAITEHGLFSNFTGPTLLDRSKFTAINVTSGSQIQFTYDLTVTGS